MLAYRTGGWRTPDSGRHGVRRHLVDHLEIIKKEKKNNNIIIMDSHIVYLPTAE